MVDHAIKTAKILPASKHSLLLLNGPLAAIQRKSPSENGFEADPKDGVPLNCNMPASKGTMQKFNEPVRIALVPCMDIGVEARTASSLIPDIDLVEIGRDPEIRRIRPETDQFACALKRHVVEPGLTPCHHIFGKAAVTPVAPGERSAFQPDRGLITGVILQFETIYGLALVIAVNFRDIVFHRIRLLLFLSEIYHGSSLCQSPGREITPRS